MKEHESSALINRRQLLKGAAACAALAALPGIEGCSGLPEHRPRVAATGQALALTNCNVIDVARGVVLPDCEIVVRDGIIQSVGDRSDTLPKDWLVYDLQLDGAQSRYNLVKAQTVYTRFQPALEKITMPEPGPVEDFVEHLQERLDEKLENGNPPDAPALNDILES